VQELRRDDKRNKLILSKTQLNLNPLAYEYKITIKDYIIVFSYLNRDVVYRNEMGKMF